MIRINCPRFHLTVIPQIRNTVSVASRITSTGTTTTSLSEPCSTLKRFNITGSNFRLIFYLNIYIIDRIIFSVVYVFVNIFISLGRAYLHYKIGKYFMHDQKNLFVFVIFQFFITVSYYSCKFYVHNV